MLAVIIVGAFLFWVVIAFALAALNRGTDSREDAHLVAWVTAFWPVTLPVIAAFVLLMGILCGGVWCLVTVGDMFVSIGGRYIDFLHGQRKPPTLTDKISEIDKKVRGIEKRYSDVYDEGPGSNGLW